MSHFKEEENMFSHDSSWVYWLKVFIYFIRVFATNIDISNALLVLETHSQQQPCTDKKSEREREIQHRKYHLRSLDMYTERDRLWILVYAAFFPNWIHSVSFVCLRLFISSNIVCICLVRTKTKAKKERISKRARIRRWIKEE